MRRQWRSHLVLRSGILLGLAVSIGTQACQATNRKAPVATGPPSDTVQCTTSLDLADGARLASGLYVRFTVRVDSAGPYYEIGRALCRERV